MDMKILLTGSNGFIGKNIYKHLKNLGRDVVCIDKYNCDLSDRKNLDYLITQLTDCELVIHCAGHADVRQSHIELKEQFDDNVVSTKTVLDAMVKANVKNLIYLSTAATNCSGIKFLNTQTMKWESEVVTETDINQPLSIYGTMKLAAEKLIEGYTHNFGLCSIILRLENIAGPHYSHGVVRDFVNKLKDNPDTLNVLGDGNQTKAYLHTTDLTRIIDCLYNALKSDDSNYAHIVNVGNTDSITVRRLANIVCEEMNLKPNIGYEDSETGFRGDTPCIVMSKQKMLSQCKGPRITSENAIRKTVRWLQNGKDNRKDTDD